MEAPQQNMYYIGLDVDKKTISYCVKDLGGQIQREGNTEIETTSYELGQRRLITLPTNTASLPIHHGHHALVVARAGYCFGR